MIEIKKNKVYVNGKKTTDPTLIGLAVLDSIENKDSLYNTMISRKDKIKLFMEEEQMRNTIERKCMIDIICSMVVFNSEDFIAKVERNQISRASAYNFISLLQQAGVLTNKEHLFT
jgi:hypothetical protein